MNTRDVQEKVKTIWSRLSAVTVHTFISQQGALCRSCTLTAGNVRTGKQEADWSRACRRQDMIQKAFHGNGCILFTARWEWSPGLLDNVSFYWYHMYLNAPAIKTEWKATERTAEKRMKQQILPARTQALNLPKINFYIHKIYHYDLRDVIPENLLRSPEQKLQTFALLHAWN